MPACTAWAAVNKPCIGVCVILPPLWGTYVWSHLHGEAVGPLGGRLPQALQGDGARHHLRRVPGVWRESALQRNLSRLSVCEIAAREPSASDATPQIDGPDYRRRRHLCVTSNVLAMSVASGLLLQSTSLLPKHNCA